MDQPKNWPEKVSYTRKYLFLNKSTQGRFEALSRKAQESIKDSKCTKQIIVAAYQPGNVAKSVKIKFLEKFPTHPAFPFYGLFSTRHISPSSLIVKYTGLVTPSLEYNQSSDYVLSFLNEFAIDALAHGNEARFINDYRGIASKPNVEFKEFLDLNTAELAIGIFSLKDPIKPNSELLINYGKSFWKERGLL